MNSASNENVNNCENAIISARLLVIENEHETCPPAPHNTPVLKPMDDHRKRLLNAAMLLGRPGGGDLDL
jgi:hypothetical protein